jgi:hypothetical protein
VEKGYKISSREFGKAVLKPLSFVVPELKTIIKEVDTPREYDNLKSREVLGI